MKGKIISIALIGVLLIGIGCIGLFTEEDPEEEINGEEDDEDEDAVKGIYMDECTGGDAEYEEFCECTYDYIVDEYGEQEFIEATMEDEWDEEFEEFIDEAAVECIEYYPE